MKRKDRLDVFLVAAVSSAVAIMLFPGSLFSSVWWSEMLKAAVGPFVGAGLAFASAMFIQSRTRRRENLSAGTLALLTIGSQYNDLLNYRRALRHEIAKREHASPGLPDWLLAPSIGPDLEPGQAIDFQSLAFLFYVTASYEVHARLVLAEQHYHALRAVNRRMSTGVEEIQKTLSTATAAKGALLSNAEIQRAVGIDSQMTMGDLLRAALTETQAEHFYLDAFAGLRDALVAMFGAEGLPRELFAVGAMVEASLPPVPAVLRRPRPPI